MHENHLLHRDIKTDRVETENIFLCKNGSVKLGDFGCVQKLKNTLHTTMTQIDADGHATLHVAGDLPVLTVPEPYS